jgi:hypothetical protein
MGLFSLAVGQDSIFTTFFYASPLMVCSYSEKSKRGGGMLNGLGATYALAVIVLC